MAIIYGLKASDGEPKGVAVNDDGELVVNLEATTVNIGDVDVLSSALPTGAATSAKQDTQITAEQAILAKIIAAPATEAKQDTIKTAVDAVTTKLSSDPSTATLQGTGNASLASIAADIALMKADLAAIRAILES